ncbi:MAG: class I SAM-dependent methyltransferase, partial [Actinomycetota bacterium]|nr:class I SAM-dependent methyltransferase [Actinomycetota bacterium]
VVRPGGRISILEVATPPNPLVRAGHRVWFRHVVPKIGAALSDPGAYRYLPDSVAYLPEDPGLRVMLRAAGFATVGRQLLQGGLSQLLTATRTGTPTGR